MCRSSRAGRMWPPPATPATTSSTSSWPAPATWSTPIRTAPPGRLRPSTSTGCSPRCGPGAAELPSPAVVDKALTYTSYLRIDELLELQTPLSEGPEHDEVLFIVIHQVYELWFKQLLHELAGLQRALEGGDSAMALHLMRRVRTILKTAVGQIDILETMTPRSFASFRD